MKEMKNNNVLQDPIKESMMTATIYKKDGRIKKNDRWGKNRVGLRFVDSFDFKDMTGDEIIEYLSEGWSSKKGYKFVINKTFVKSKNLLTGEMFYERYDTPNCCSPSSESYWSM